MKRLFINIAKLVQTGEEARKKPLRGAEMSILKTVENAFLLTDNDKISSFGKMSELQEKLRNNLSEYQNEGEEVIDLAEEWFYLHSATPIPIWLMQAAGAGVCR